MTDPLVDSFTVLGLDATASEADIKRAYRKLSLKLHPDKVAKDVDPTLAATRFHQLNLAYETLLDPATRAKASQKSQQEQQRRERQQQYQGKRKQMADELEREEQEAIRRKHEERQRLERQREEVEELRRQGRRMREERAAREAAAVAAEVSSSSHRPPPLRQYDNGDHNDAAAATYSSSYLPSNGADEPPSLSPLDLTTLLRFPTTHYTYLIGASPSPSETIDATSLTSSPPSHPLTTPLALALSQIFGPLTDLRFQLPSSHDDEQRSEQKKKKKKTKRIKSEVTAVASFRSFPDAWHAVQVGGELQCPGEVLADVWVGWAGVAAAAKAGGTEAEVEEAVPQRVRWYNDRGIKSATDLKGGGEDGHTATSTSPSQPTATTTTTAGSMPKGGFSFKPPPPSFSSFGPSNTGNGNGKVGGYRIDAEYENATLQRLRDAERQRIEEEIRRSDRKEEGGS